MKKELLKKIKIPDKPGVYFFKKTSPQPSPGRRGSPFPFQGKARDEVLYIGKATSLRDRTKSYFSKDLIQTRGPLIIDMVFKANKLEWQETDSVLEAIILEANLIKKHQPYYNTKEKDDKSFNYVCITKEKLPKVIVIRGRRLSEIENFSGFTLPRVRGGTHTIQNFQSRAIFGPYTNSPQLREAMKIIRRIFPFLDDKSKNCLEFYQQINLAPDLNDRKLYLQNIRNIKLFFSGKKQQILKNLKKEMKNYAKNREFEKAGEIKRQIFALQHINDVALLKENFADNKIFDPAPFFGRRKGNKAGPSDAKISSSASFFRIEAYDIAHMGGKNMVGVMTVVEGGEVTKSEYKKFRIRTQSNANDTGALREVLERRMAHPEWPYPSLIVLDGGVAQLHAGMSVLKKLSLKIPVVAVLKDEKHKPKDILGDKNFTLKYKREILLANSEAHRFAIAYHKNLRNRNFLK
jgi:excinuclease ABC subunit C